MTERWALRRLELALAALGLTAGLLVSIVALDLLHYHGLAVDEHVLLGIVDGVVIARAAVSLVRRLREQRAFLRRLPVSRVTTVHGHRVRVVPGAVGAFCAGLLRPAVYVAEGTLRSAGDAELRAILAHEEHHRVRRDPLRLLIARVIADALTPLPPFAALAEREAAIADLAADAASVRALGDATPLATALARFDASGAGVAPERVDRLVGAGTATIPSTLLAAAGIALAGIVAVIVTMLLADWHPDLTMPLSLEPAALIVACAPACVAVRRAGACLRPAA